MTAGNLPEAAFVGLGLMGLPMARRLLAVRPGLRVWNRTPARAALLADGGAEAATSPAQATKGAEVVALCLTDGNAVEAVLFGSGGVAEGAGRNTVVLDHSTVAPAQARSMAERLRTACGAELVDAPVTGGVRGAESGTLVVFAGGAEDAIARGAEMAAAYASRIERVGPSGAGQVVKLCNQVVVMGTMAVCTEATLLAERGGIDPTNLVAAFRGGLADSELVRFLVPKVASRSDEVTATLRTALKDLDLIRAQAAASRTPAPVSAAAAELVRAMVGRGDGDLDFSQLVRLFDSRRRGSLAGPLPRA